MSKSLRRFWDLVESTAAVPVLGIWLVGFILFGLAVSAAYGRVENARAADVFDAALPDLLKVKLTPAGDDDYRAVIQSLQAVYPGLRIELAQPAGGVHILGQDVESLEHFMSALSAVMAVKPGLRWSLREICMQKTGCSGGAFSAVVTAERLDVQAEKMRRRS